MRRSVLWLAGAAATIAVELALYLNHPAHEARVHWFTHFFVGGTVALVGMTVWVVQENRRVRLMGLWVILGHLVAMFPDLLFAAGIPHRRWMDAFLGHLTSDAIPGHNVTWYAIFLAALAMYLSADVRLVSAQSAGRRGRRRRRRH